MNTVEMFVDEMMNRVTNIGIDTIQEENRIETNAAVAAIRDQVEFNAEQEFPYVGNIGNATMDNGGVTGLHHIGTGNGLPTNAAEGEIFYNQNDGHSWIRMNNDDASAVEEPQMAFDDPVEETEDLIEDNASLEALNIKLYEALEFAFGFDTTGKLELAMKCTEGFEELWE